ncbi:MAG: MFS transporter [bacterium]|nr:MFS transporter [bacterium]
MSHAASPESDPSPSAANRNGLGEAVETFRLPHYGALWGSNLIQFVCFHVLFMAMQWLVTSLTDLRAGVTFLSMIQGASIAIASPFAGVVVDRYAKRNLIVLGRLGLVGVATTTALLVYAGALEYWGLVAIGVVGGALASVLGPATQTFVVDVVGRNRTQHAVTLNSIGSSFGTVGGAALAGVLIGAVGVVGTYLIAAVGVIVSAFAVLRIPTLGRAERSERTSLGRDLREGFAYVRERPALMLALLACAMAIFNGAIGPMRVIFAKYVFEAGPSGFGAMSAAHGIGTMGAALFLTLRPPTKNFGLLITGTMFLYAVGILLFSFAFSFEYILAVELFLGVVGQAWNICAMVGFQLVVPPEMRGRVLSMVLTLAQLGFVGAGLVGLLADAVGDQLAVGIFGAIPTTLLALQLLFGWRVLKQMQVGR